MMATPAERGKNLYGCVEAADSVGWARATLDDIMLSGYPDTIEHEATDYVVKELADSLDKLVELTCLPVASHPALQELARDLRSVGRSPEDQIRMRDISTVDIPEAMEVQ